MTELAEGHDMRSLTEAYDRVGSVSLKRLYLGFILFLVGAGLAVVGIAIATTNVHFLFGLNTYEARKLAGVFAGLGIPAVFIGIFSVLPADPRERAIASIGASIAIFGVVLFWYAYPTRWYGASPNHLTLHVVTIYFFGMIATFWSLFRAALTFKTRKLKEGLVQSEHPNPKKKHPVKQTKITGGMGGIGLSKAADSRIRQEELSESAEVTHSSDGGQTRTHSPARRSKVTPDKYCGNCAAFDYVRNDDGFQPYCGYRDEEMDTMDPCDEWYPWSQD